MEGGLAWWHTSVKFERQAEEVHKFETCLIYMESLKPIQIESLPQKQNDKKKKNGGKTKREV